MSSNNCSKSSTGAFQIRPLQAFFNECLNCNTIQWLESTNPPIESFLVSITSLISSQNFHTASFSLSMQPDQTGLKTRCPASEINHLEALDSVHSYLSRPHPVTAKQTWFARPVSIIIIIIIIIVINKPVASVFFLSSVLSGSSTPRRQMDKTESKRGEAGARLGDDSSA